MNIRLITNFNDGEFIEIKLIKKYGLENINHYNFLNSLNIEYVIFEIQDKQIYGYNFCKKLANKIIEFIKENDIKKYVLNCKEIDLINSDFEYLIENLYLESYEFNKYKTTEKKHIELNILINENNIQNINLIKDMNEFINISKDLINTPSNELYPETLAEETKNLGQKYGFQVDVLDIEEIKKLNMNALYSVSKGSEKNGKLIIIKYIGDKENKECLGLVGKGITYDSGGYSIKSTNSMLNMKDDMGGAAILIGAICAIAKNKIKKNVTIIIPTCENLISGNSYKPGDIISTMSKLTVEIENTDCEGRLILSDAIYYIVEKENVNKLLTIATLTGGAYNTFGEFITPFFANNDEIKKELINAAEISNETIWEMPLSKDFEEYIIGNIADLKNSGGKVGGLISSALFLEKFNTKNIPWIHLDIAGNVISSKTKLATGKCCKLIYNFIKGE